MIPCCFHPTRVVLVNDDLELLRKLFGGNDLSKRHVTFDSFINSHQLFHYLNEAHSPEPFYKRYGLRKGERAGGSVSLGNQPLDIYHEIYRSQRFDEISTVLMNYSPMLTGMSGLEFFQKMKKSHIQKILLIDKNDEPIAVDALSKGLIDHYICSQAPNFEEEFYEAVQNAQWQYFNNLSEVFLKEMYPDGFENHPFVDPNFQKFFKAILSNYGFTEAYLYESIGSYLFLDDQAQDHGLLINMAEQLDFWVRSGQAKGVKLPLLKDLKSRKKMMCYPARTSSFEPDKSHWEVYAHPAQTFQGRRNTFYYAFAPNMYDIDLDRILPFQEYREHGQKR
jgi:phage anti-repressor protein